jgi:WD40 repeat protein
MRKIVGYVPVMAIAMAVCLWGNPRKLAMNEADFGPTAWINSVAFSPDGHTIFATGFKKPGTFTVTFWDIASGKARQALNAPTRSVENNATLSPDGRTLAATNNAVYFSDNFTILLWDVATGKQLHTLSGNGLKIRDLAFTPDGRTLLSGSEDFTLRLFDVATGKQIKLIPTGDDKPGVVAITPDGKTIASGNNNSPGSEGQAGDPMNTLQLWDATTGQITHALSSQKDWTSTVVFSPDGHTLASAGLDYSITLWDVATGKSLLMIPGQNEAFTSLAFSPDGRTLASGCDDNTIKLWNVTTGKLILLLTGHTDSVISVAFSPDGLALASGSNDNTVKLWDVASGKLLNTFGAPNPPTDSTGAPAKRP